MLDINLMRENPDTVRAALVKREDNPGIVDRILALDEQRRSLLYQIETLKAELNAGSKQTGKLPKEAIKDYAIQRWSFQAHANPAMMLSHAAYLQGDDVEHLLENAYDEIFRLAGEGDHRERVPRIPERAQQDTHRR